MTNDIHCPNCGRFLRHDKIDEGTEDEDTIGFVCTHCMKLFAEPEETLESRK